VIAHEIEETGTGPWVVFAWCNAIWERVRVPNEEAARLHRCRLGCRQHHLITRPEGRGIFSFTLENE